MEPTIVYKSGGPNKAGKGKTYSWIGVKTEVEMGKYLGNGWFKTLEEAINPPKVKKKEYKVGLPEDKKLKAKPKTMKNLDGEDITEGSLGELHKRGKGRPKFNKEVFGDDG